MIFPFLKAVAEALPSSCKAEFEVGETPLIAMEKQLKDEDDALYHADGILKLYGLKELEILLLETSSFFGCNSGVKKSFDHHKGLFGALAMLKTIADTFYFGSLDTLSKIKILFVHAAGNFGIYMYSYAII